MKHHFLLLSLVLPMWALAQVPKMDMKLVGGTNTSALVYRQENVDSDILFGWQAGTGFRVTYRDMFGELDIMYVEDGITLSPREGSDIGIDTVVNVRRRSINVPITAGYLPVKTPWLKWYVYGGISNDFTLKGRVDYRGEEIKFKPKEAQLKFYNLGARFGSQLDIAMFNIDFHYTIGVTNAFRDATRTNKHSLTLNIGFLF